MIYIHLDLSNVPQEKLDALKAAAEELGAIADLKLRKKFIKDNADKWSALRDHLSALSHNKCWYSEARDSVSRYQIDHFRPHGRAKQGSRNFFDGYSWLAFDPVNFRLAGVLCNTLNQEYSDETVGKGDWFPLRDPDARANLANRDCSAENPILLDPTDPDDPPKLLFNDDGSVIPSMELEEDDANCVTESIKFLGLDQDLLKRNRANVWRECDRKIAKYNRIAKRPKGNRTVEEEETLKELLGELVSMAKPDSEFSAVSRCCLVSNKLDYLIFREELRPLALPAI